MALIVCWLVGLLCDDGSVVLVCRDSGACWLIVVLVVGSCRSAFMSMVGGMPWLSVVGYEATSDNLISIKRGISS